VGTRALRVAAAGLLLGAVTATSPGDAQPDPFVAMNALRVTPPAPAPDATFRALDGRRASLDTLRGRSVLLTFFTTW